MKKNLVVIDKERFLEKMNKVSQYGEACSGFEGFMVSLSLIFKEFRNAQRSATLQMKRGSHVKEK